MFNVFIFDAILFYNEIKTNLTMKLRLLRKEYPIVDSMCERVSKYIGSIYWLTVKRIEPSLKDYYIETYSSDSNFTIEKFFRPDSISCNYQHFVDTNKDSFIFTQITPTQMRIKHCSDANILDITGPLVKSSVKFISVKFKCKECSLEVEIDIPKSHYLVGNQILSKEYILRYLDFNVSYWDTCSSNNDPLDGTCELYTVDIMDNNLHSIQLQPGQCILLAENSYEIQSVTNKIER
jgi:hypothetical protein